MWAGGVGRPSWEPGSHNPANKSSGKTQLWQGQDSVLHPHLHPLFLSLPPLCGSAKHSGLGAKDLGSDPESGTSQLCNWANYSILQNAAHESLTPQGLCSRSPPSWDAMPPHFPVVCSCHLGLKTNGISSKSSSLQSLSITFFLFSLSTDP